MRRRQRGFSLLEAIVALVIFSMVAMVLYGWQSTNLHALQRAEAHARENRLTRSALGVLAHVNPMKTPSGERPLGRYTVHWTAKPVQPVKPGVTAVGLPDLFEIGLYVLDVQVSDGDRTLTTFQLRRVGYRQVHALSSAP
ncbi:MAG: prepilin-type N-terminal cleavage/methylation domain-containing protein [Xanthomonadaceae bacterium]|nr:prepilin-type N-terminal cleavage/methylation domain-containing protein [Xanthomonadaceae bacterium]